ncbi:CHAT domain-containing protein [Leptolyngbya sp. FACHB-711]|uniref:CHAT domain-containing protein n=1 Tax=Leptolyngbya sp. FACHB-711 TaxID=2692813 RepID=UPI001686AFA3|nr:CHAT domain-containing protein [Leptolyngbya sp. FACHB-711]MBD2025820.1 CHAT domain-containing protein [Leptolyngbya sp. FACHB-711]
MRTILILSSNPKGTSVLDLDREIRDIREGLRRSPNRNQFQIEVRGAVRPIDLRRSLLDEKPQIVHFCGHGSGEGGLVLETDRGEAQLVESVALAELFAEFATQVECILLNACYSEVQANALIQHINYVIGMNREIPDAAAIAFSIGFYDGIGAGKSIEEAYRLGCSAIRTDLPNSSTDSRKLIPIASPENAPPPVLPDYLIPVLKQKEQLNSIVLPILTPPTPKSQLEPLIGHSDWIRSLAFSPDGRTIFSSSNDRTVRVWDVAAGRLLHLLTGHRDRVKCVGMSPDGQLMLSCSADGQVRGWDRSLLTHKKIGDCRYIVKATSRTITLVNTLPVSPNPQRPIFATGAEHGKISIWNLETGQWQRSISAHSSPVLSLAFGADGKRLASGSQNKTIKLWDLDNSGEKPLYEIGNAHLSQVLSLAISNQYQILVSGGADRTIKLWNLATGEKRSPKHILEGHAGQVWCVAVSPDGSRIASASADFTVKLWNIETGELLQTFTGHLGEVRTVTFSANGKLVASGGDDLEIKLWEMPV